MDLQKINTLIFSGGGFKGVGLIGFIRALKIYKNMDEIVHFIGSSVGAFVAFLLIINYSDDELEKILLNYDFKNMIPTFDLDTFIYNVGISDGIKIKEFFSKLLKFKYDVENITFIELYNKTKKKLTITVTNYSKRRVEYWNYETKPNINIIDALMATTCVPLFFHPYKIEDDYYIDGCVTNQYPILLIPIDDIFFVLGVSLSQIYEEFDCCLQTEHSHSKVFTYIVDIMRLTYKSSMMMLNNKYLERTLFLNMNCSDPMNFLIPNEEKLNMINLGFEQTETYIKKNFLIPDND